MRSLREVEIDFIVASFSDHDIDRTANTALKEANRGFKVGTVRILSDLATECSVVTVT